MRIIVADDIEEIMSFTRMVLERAFPTCEVTLSRDGAEALDAILCSEFDILITDWNMPIMTGPDLIREIRSRPQLANLFIIMMTGETSNDPREAMQAGADAFLLKPCPAEKLRAVLEKRSLGSQVDIRV